MAVYDAVCVPTDAIQCAGSDIDDFLAPKDIDAVAVLTGSGMHRTHVTVYAKTGKHVVVQKPMALRLQEADAMDPGLRRLRRVAAFAVDRSGNVAS